MQLNKLIIFYTIILLLFLFLVKNCDGYVLINDEIRIEKYIKKNNSNLTPEQRELIANSIMIESSYYSIPFKITLAIIEVESNFDIRAVGAAGEIGLMQIYSQTCFDVRADKTRLFEIRYNISFGLCILSSKLRSAKNDIAKAIERYNGSGRAARRYVIKVLSVLNKINKEFSNEN